jgi:hypothetical protein
MPNESKTLVATGHTVRVLLNIGIPGLIIEATR